MYRIGKAENMPVVTGRLAATEVQMLLRSSNLLTVIHDHNYFKELRILINSIFSFRTCTTRFKIRLVNNIEHK